MSKNKLSPTYRFLRALGFNYSEEEYGQVSLWRVIKQALGNIKRKLLQSMMDWVILEPFLPRKLRPLLLRGIGCKVGENVFIGDHVRVDLNHSNLILIEDNVHITSGCRLLCHQRDLTNYCVGDDYTTLGYNLNNIRICKGAAVGMNSFILPGVTIGEGAVVGAGSLVTKDVPAWTIATGRPAKVVKMIPERVHENK